MMTVYTAINVPYGAMLGVVTEDSSEKTVFSSFRMFFAYGGSFIAVALFEPLVKFFGGGTTGWQMAVGVIGVICMLLFFATFALTRERVKPIENRENRSVWRDIIRLLKNVPWWILLVAGISALLFNSIRGGAAAYFFKDFVGGASLMSNVIFTAGLFLSVGEISNMLGVVLAVPISKRIGKKNTYIGAMVVSAVLSVLFFFIPATAAGYWTMLALQIIISIAAGITFPLLWSMYADVADYAELQSGSVSTGLIFSSSSMAQKFGGAFGGALILWLLAAYGYDTAPDVVQSSEAIDGVRSLMSWIPAAGCAIAAFAMLFYPLSEKRVKEISIDLEKMRRKVHN
jgi:GPH family glycoside/pentoside/hexuronide:cation symporter